MRVQTILYNLQAWLATEDPSIVTVAGGFLENSPQEVTAIIDNGGNVLPWYERTDVAIQTITRSVSRVSAGHIANTLTAIMRGRFGGVTLPEVTVEKEVYPEVVAWSFVPQSKPGYIGIDENRLHMWSANFTIVVGG